MNNEASADRREKTIVRASITAVLANIVLAAFKAAVGFISNSIAVTLDAVNNLSDALSSVITIIGTKLAGRKPDKKHPLGHGRAEYLSAMVVAALVLYAGVTSLVESVKKIISPEAADYSAVSLIIIASAVIVKLALGLYVRSVGKKVNSGALTASGSDALFDSIISLSVLVSAVIFLIFGISLEAYVGVVISLFIIKSGFEMLKETIDEIIGTRVDSELSSAIKNTISEDGDVRGVYDLILNNYGPDRYIGSVHVAVDDTMRADEIDAMTRRINQAVYEQFGIIMTGIGIYSVNTGDDEAAKMRSEVTRRVMSKEGVIQTHGFFADTANKTLTFDVIIDFDAPGGREQVYSDICREISELYPDYTIRITLDTDITD